MSLAERFWAKVEKTEACWVWQAAKVRDGYGTIKVAGFDRPAHRVSWEMHFGEIPAGLKVLHKCDNPPCIKPDHLFLGTHQENMDDCVRKGRRKATPGSFASRGESCQRGHPFDEANTYRRRNGQRECKECRRGHHRAWHSRQQAD